MDPFKTEDELPDAFRPLRSGVGYLENQPSALCPPTMVPTYPDTFSFKKASSRSQARGITPSSQ
jgi:hypothetical protein